jgi:hypothetical protein
VRLALCQAKLAATEGAVGSSREPEIAWKSLAIGPRARETSTAALSSPDRDPT